MFEFPAPPPARGYESTSKTTLRPRFEDITQSGAVQLHALLPGLGAIWHADGAQNHLQSMRRAGVLPILYRIVALGEPGPFSTDVPLTMTGTWRLARETDGDRIFMDAWLEVHAPHASTLAGPPPPDAPHVLVGRVLTQHVITRPFAPPNERKVTELDLPGLPRIPEDTHAYESALLVPSEATRAADILFGPMHTDANQHVNSLVYPRVFEERVVERLGRPLLARRLDVRWRRPFFAGERAEVSFAVAERPGGVVALGAFTPPGSARPSATIALELE